MKSIGINTIRYIKGNLKIFYILLSILLLITLTYTVFQISDNKEHLGRINKVFVFQRKQEIQELNKMIKSKSNNIYRLRWNGLLEEGILDEQNNTIYITEQYFYQIKDKKLIAFILENNLWTKVKEFPVSDIGERENYKYTKNRFKFNYDYLEEKINLTEVIINRPDKLSDKLLEGRWEEEYNLQYIAYSNREISNAGYLFKDGSVYKYQIRANENEDDIINGNKEPKTIKYDSYHIEENIVYIEGNNKEGNQDFECQFIGSHLYCYGKRLRKIS